ncbi:hypothetical protein B0H14DRAFT_2560572 [Mycena olivaceomarginata]|nr:hypothetical protein B0H14DRAFT_2560572 [Mycena olivaceomarginata]
MPDPNPDKMWKIFAFCLRQIPTKSPKIAWRPACSNPDKFAQILEFRSRQIGAGGGTGLLVECQGSSDGAITVQRPSPNGRKSGLENFRNFVHPRSGKGKFYWHTLSRRNKLLPTDSELCDRSISEWEEERLPDPTALFVTVWEKEAVFIAKKCEASSSSYSPIPSSSLGSRTAKTGGWARSEHRSVHRKQRTRPDGQIEGDTEIGIMPYQHFLGEWRLTRPLNGKSGFFRELPPLTFIILHDRKLCSKEALPSIRQWNDIRCSGTVLSHSSSIAQ